MSATISQAVVLSLRPEPYLSEAKKVSSANREMGEAAKRAAAEQSRAERAAAAEVKRLDRERSTLARQMARDRAAEAKREAQETLAAARNVAREAMRLDRERTAIARQMARDRANAARAAAREEQEAVRSAARAYQEKQRAAADSAAASKRALGTVLDGIFNIRNAVAALGLGVMVRDLWDAATAAQQIHINFELIGGGPAGGTAIYGQLRDDVNRLGLSLQETAQQYGSFAFAAKLAGLTSTQIRTTFLGVAEAGTVMHLSSERMSLALLALEQTASKGKVTMEELRKQLGQHIPGAVEIAARAMGMTNSQFNDMVSKGKILAEDFLPKFGAELSRQFGPALAAAVTSAQANLNRVKTAIYEIRTAAAEGLLEGLASGLTDLRRSLSSDEVKAAARDLGVTLGQAARTAAEAVAELVRWIDLLKFAIVGLLALRFAGFLTTAAAAVRGLSFGINSLAYVTPLAARVMALLSRALGGAAVTAGGFSAVLGGVALVLAAGAIAMYRYIKAQEAASIQMQKELGQSADVMRYLDQLHGRKTKLTEQEYELAQAIRTRIETDAAGARAEAQALDARLKAARLKLAERTVLGSGIGLTIPGAREILTAGPARDVRKLSQATEDAKGKAREYDNQLTLLDANLKRLGHSTKKATTETEDNAKASERAARAIADQVDELRKLVAAKAEELRLARSGSAIEERESARRAAIAKAIEAAEKALAQANKKPSAELVQELTALAAAAFDFGAAADDTKESVAALRAATEGARDSASRYNATALTQIDSSEAWNTAIIALESSVNDLRIAIGHTATDTAAHAEAERALASIERDLTNAIKGRADWQERQARAQLRTIANQRAGIEASLEEIRLSTRILQSRGEVADALEREAALRAEIKRIVDQSVQKVGDESQQAFEARWNQAAAAVRATLEENYRASIRYGIEEPIREAAASMQGQFLDAVVAWASGSKDAFRDLIKQWLAMWARAMLEWLARWIATQAKAAAASRAAKIAGGDSGGGSLSSLGSLAGAGGGSSASGSAAGAGAAALGTVAVFAAIYVGVSAWIRSHRREWAELTVGAGANGVTDTAGSKKSVEALGKMLEGFVDNVRSFFREYNARFVELESAVSVGSSGQGKKKSYYVKLAGQIVANFGNDAQAAMEAALILAVKNSSSVGLSPLVKQAIKESIATTVEQFQSELAKATEISNLGQPEVVTQVRSAAVHFDELRLSLERFNEITPAVIQGFANITAAEVASWLSARDAITGRQRTAAEERKLREAEALAYNAELALRKANVQVMIAEARARLLEYQSHVHLVSGGGGGGQGGGRGGGLVALASAVLNVASVVDAATTIIAGSGDAMLDSLRAQLAALEDLGRALADIKPIDIGEINLGGGRGGGGGSVRDDRQRVRDLLEEFRLSKLTDFARALHDINQKWDEAEKLAHGNRELLDAINKARKEEIALLRQRITQDLYKNIKDFERSPYAQGGVTDAILGIQDRAKSMREEFLKTAKDMGWSAERIAKGLARISAAEERHLRFLSDQGLAEVAGGLAEYVTDATLKGELLRRQNEINFKIRMAQLSAEYEMVKALGFLTDADKKLIEDAFDFIRRNPPDFSGGATTGNGATTTTPSARDLYLQRLQEAADAAAERLQHATELLERYESDGLDPFFERLRELNRDFTEIRAVFGDTARVQAAYNAALMRIINEQVRPIEEWLNSISLSERSPLNASGRLQETQRQFSELFQAVQGGQYQRIDDLVRLADELLSAQAAVNPQATTAYRQFYEALRGQMAALMSQIRAAGGSGQVPGQAGLGGIPGSPLAGPMPQLPTGTSGARAGGSDPVTGAIVDQSNLLTMHLSRISGNTERTAVGVERIARSLENRPALAS